MRKAIIAAVAAIALAPLLMAPTASAAPCGASGTNEGAGVPACQVCESTTNYSLACFDSGQPVQAPANPQNDPCAFNLQPPNPSVGAYNGCETARQATGG